ncbi:putative efflux protein, MATE family [Thermoflavimicrobium dichotomicum]|uniref:Putative efflux protein, MATE family n=2 Tax=Thermoflavimicrobium dichotomicum TaxID=46223 RepID=A0A1I3MHH0_9BACL|nr:putative efflux protein, MATE family [Thermoflavimicrobium dichotomicum]
MRDFKERQQEEKMRVSSVDVAETHASKEEIEEKNGGYSRQGQSPIAQSDLLRQNQAIWRSLFVFLIPMILSNALQSLGSTISMMIMGRGLGESTLAAASSVMSMVFFLISLIIGLGSASSVLIGQAYGSRQIERLKETVNTSLKFSFLFGLVMAAVGLLFTRELLQIVKTPPGVMDLASSYAQILFISLPIQFIYISYTTFLRGTGDSKTPFYFLVISTILSIALCPVLAFGWFGIPVLGMRGVALANTMAILISMILLFVYLYKTKHILALDLAVFKSLRMDLQILKLMIKIGIPTGIQMVFVSLSMIAVVSFVNRFGAQAAAAYGAVIQIISYVQLPALSLGMATGIFGSQLIGAGQPNRLKDLLKSAVWMNYIMGGILVMIVYLFSHSLLSLFLAEKATLEVAQKMLFLVLWAYLIFGNSIILAGMMRSSGTVFWPTLIGILSIWCVQVPLAYFLSHVIGLEGILAAYPIAFTCSALAQYTYYRWFWRTKQHKSLFMDRSGEKLGSK